MSDNRSQDTRPKIVPMPRPSRQRPQAIAQPMPIPRYPVPGDDAIAAVAERVIQHPDLAIPGEHGWQMMYPAVAGAIIAETHVRWRHDQPWMFHGRCYQPGEGLLPALALKIAAAYAQKDPRRTARVISETVAMILQVAPRSADWDKRYWDAQPVIPCQNGTLDLTDPQHPQFFAGTWDPEHRATWYLHADWDPIAECPAVDEFLAGSVPDPNQRELLLEYLGLTLAHWDLTRQSYLFLLGSGSNGKGILLSAVRATVGEAYTAVSIGDLAANRFAAATLIDAVANVVGDDSAGIVKDASRLKQATGGDAMSAEAKFRTAYAAVPKAKLIFSLNQLPRITDFSIGFFRRPLIVEFPRTFPKNTQLEDALTAPDALSRWTRLAVEAYGRLCARGDFAREYARASLSAWRQANDIVAAAVGEGFIRIDPTGTVPQDQFLAGMKICGQMIGMECPRLAELISRMQSLAAWEAQGQSQPQPVPIRTVKPHGASRLIQGISWGSEIYSARYRPTPAAEYQSMAAWVGIPEPVQGTDGTDEGHDDDDVEDIPDEIFREPASTSAREG